MAKVAAKWWTDHLRKGAKLDHGDPSQVGGMAVMMGHLTQHIAETKRTPEQEQAFEDALYEKFLDYDRHWVGIDYHPWGLFEESAKEAGFTLSSSCLPWKTNMYFSKNGEIKVILGYGGEPKIILDSVEEEV